MSYSSSAYLGYGFAVPSKHYADAEDQDEWANVLARGAGLQYLFCGPTHSTLLVWAPVADLSDFDRQGPGYVTVGTTDGLQPEASAIASLQALHAKIDGAGPIGLHMAGARW